MNIKTITFKRNVQVKPYESAAFEVMADVAEGDDPAVVAQQLREFVEEELDVYARARQRENMPF